MAPSKAVRKSATANNKCDIKLCPVCSARSNGRHYGVDTCGACSTFFCDARKEEIEDSCENGNNCVISEAFRNSCRICRYNKCIKAGMRKIQKKEATTSSKKSSPDSTSTTLAGSQAELKKKDTTKEQQMAEKKNEENKPNQKKATHPTHIQMINQFFDERALNGKGTSITNINTFIRQKWPSASTQQGKLEVRRIVADAINKGVIRSSKGELLTGKLELLERLTKGVHEKSSPKKGENQPPKRRSSLGSTPLLKYIFTRAPGNRKKSSQGIRQGERPDSPAPKCLNNMMKYMAKHPNSTAAHEKPRRYGHPMLKDILAKRYSHVYNVHVDSLNNVLVTPGPYLSLHYAFLGLVNKGDEVLILEPADDCYFPQVEFAGGVPISIVMNLAEGATSASQFTIDFIDMESKITEKTKMLVINNPHNPTGKLFSRQELTKLADIAEKHNLIVIADEVYEFHVWNKTDMIRFASLPGMYERTISIGSAGKDFSVTGRKLGWAVGPKQLLEPCKVFRTEMDIAQAFKLDWSKFLTDPNNSCFASGLFEELRGKRDKLAKMLEEGKFGTIIPDAGLFMLVDYSQLKEGLNLATENGLNDPFFSRYIGRGKKVVAMPLSAFYSSQNNKLKNSKMVRLCYLEENESVGSAAEIFKNLRKK